MLTGKETVAAVQQIGAKLGEMASQLNTDIAAIRADATLAKLGKDQKEAALRRDVSDRATPIFKEALDMIAAAERREKGWGLDAFLPREEFAAIQSDRDALVRVHVASVLPRMPVDELAGFMASAVAANDAWRVSMARREARHRLDADVSQSQRRALSEIVSAALAIEPPDIKGMRDAVAELQRIRPYIERRFREISAPGAAARDSGRSLDALRAARNEPGAAA